MASPRGVTAGRERDRSFSFAAQQQHDVVVVRVTALPAERGHRANRPDEPSHDIDHVHGAIIEEPAGERGADEPGCVSMSPSVILAFADNGANPAVVS